MFPGTFLTPAMVPPGMLGVLFAPAGFLVPLAALVAGVVTGLSVALALQEHSKPGKTGERGTVRSLRVVGPTEREDRAAA